MYMTVVISRLFNYFFLPPGIFILLLAVGIFFYFFKRQRVLIFTAIISGSFMYLLSMEPVKDLLLFPLEKYAEENGLSYYEIENPYNKIADCIVLLGGGIYEKSPDYSGRASPYPDAVKRAIYTYLAYRSTGLPIITSGGERAGLKETTPEGEALKYLLEKLGVPRDRITSENSSKNTYQNILHIKRIMVQNGWKRAYIITSAYHMRRTMWVCKRLGVDAFPVPTDYKMRREGYTVESFLPGSLAFTDSKKALHEYLGLVYYRMVY